jgi:phosphoglycolate phosphatase-like HAD superfamily hydrolase
VLALWDIDGTLLKSEHAGIHAMLEALNELHPGRSFSFDGIEVSGRLDPLIYRELAAKHGKRRVRIMRTTSLRRA